MKFSELKDLTVDELKARGEELRKELFNLKIQKATARLEKPASLRNLRHDIARVETRISQLRAQS